MRLWCMMVALYGFTVVSFAQTHQDVVDARNKGAELMAAGDLDGAIAELEKCVDLKKKIGEDAEVHGSLIESNLPNLYLQKAVKIKDTKDYPATIKALEATVAAAEKYNNPNVKEKAEKTIPRIYFEMGTADFSAQKYNEAVQNLDQAIARDSSMAGAYYVRGECYQVLADETNMVESYQQAIEKANVNGDVSTAQKARKALSKYYYNAGNAARRVQKWDDAIAAFTKTVEVDNKNADAYYAMAGCFNSKKNYEQAIASCEKALQLRDEADSKALDPIYYELGTAYAGKNNTGKACEYFKKIANEPFLGGAKYQIESALKCK